MTGDRVGECRSSASINHDLLGEVAGVSRGSAYSHHKETTASIRADIPVLVRA